MHIPDGVIGPGVSAAAGVVAASGFGIAVSRARRYLTDRLVPVAALVTAFVFAGQMINFPVLPGMSGHLLGGVLAAVLVGPWAGYLVVEPTSNLDPASRKDLTGILDSLDVTQLLVTHDLLYALEICERSLIIDGGRIVADGATREILGDPQLLAEHRLGLPVGLRIEDLDTS